MVEAGNVLFDNKTDIMETINNIPLSTSSNTHNTELLAKENYSHLIHALSTTSFYSIILWLWMNHVTIQIKLNCVFLYDILTIPVNSLLKKY